MSLGTEVGLAPGDIVLDGDPAIPAPKGAHQPPTFRPMSVLAKQSPMSVSADLLFFYMRLVTRWCNRYGVGLAINSLRVQILLGATLRNNLGQVVHTYVRLSRSSITWYRPKGSDTLRLGL